MSMGSAEVRVYRSEPSKVRVAVPESGVGDLSRPGVDYECDDRSSDGLIPDPDISEHEMAALGDQVGPLTSGNAVT